MIFVTHDMGAVERFCDRAMLLERGPVVDIGDPASIARQYNHHNFRRWREEARRAGGASCPPEDPAATVRQCRASSPPTARRRSAAAQGETCCVRMDVHFREAIEHPAFSITLLDESHRPVFTTNTDTQRIDTGAFEAGSDATIRLQLRELPRPGALPPGGVGRPARASAPTCFTPICRTRSSCTADKPGGGMADLPHTLRDRAPLVGRRRGAGVTAA